MKKFLLTTGMIFCLVTSAIADSSTIGFNIKSIVSHFKNKTATGIELGVGYDRYVINYSISNGNFKKKSLIIFMPINIFFENLLLKTNSFKDKNNFIGIYYRKFIYGDLFSKRSFDEDNLMFFLFKGGVSVNNNNPYLIGISYNFIKNLTKESYLFSEVGINFYKFGVESDIKIGLGRDF